jgi:hypothetical protein
MNFSSYEQPVIDFEISCVYTRGIAQSVECLNLLEFPLLSNCDIVNLQSQLCVQICCGWSVCISFMRAVQIQFVGFVVIHPFPILPLPDYEYVYVDTSWK